MRCHFVAVGILAMGLLALSAAPLWAEPTAFGDTGLILVPTSETALENAYDMYGHNLVLNGQAMSTLSVTTGVDDQLEISAAGVVLTGAAAVFSLNAKYRFNRSRWVDTPLAIGFTDILDQTPRGRTGYLVATNYLNEEERYGSEEELPWRVTFGVSVNNLGTLRAIGGVDGELTNDTQAAVEYDGQNLNLALRYVRGWSDNNPHGWAADLGLLRAFSPGGNSLYIGIGYRTYSD